LSRTRNFSPGRMPRGLMQPPMIVSSQLGKSELRAVRYAREAFGDCECLISPYRMRTARGSIEHPCTSQLSIPPSLHALGPSKRQAAGPAIRRARSQPGPSTPTLPEDSHEVRRSVPAAPLRSRPARVGNLPGGRIPWHFPSPGPESYASDLLSYRVAAGASVVELGRWAFQQLIVNRLRSAIAFAGSRFQTQTV